MARKKKRTQDGPKLELDLSEFKPITQKYTAEQLSEGQKYWGKFSFPIETAIIDNGRKKNGTDSTSSS